MTAEPQRVTTQDLNQLLADAVSDEVSGRLESSLAGLVIVVAELCSQGRIHQYLFEWLARLHAALGEHEAAERALAVGLRIAQDKAHRPGAFRMELALVRNACEALEMSTATARLAELRDGSGNVLSDPSPHRREQILEWVRRIHFAEQPATNVAVLQVEAALTIAELWAQQGKYRSALWLTDGVDGLIGSAASTVRRDQIELLRSEWELAAGHFEDCQRRLASLRTSGPIDEVRLALVCARVALACGALSQALLQLETLATAPLSAPTLFAYAVVMRIAVHAELNQHVAAEALATEAIAQLGDGPEMASLVRLVKRARQGAVVRRRSVLELWEASLVPGEARPEDAPMLLPLGLDKASFGAAWVDAINQILVALEAGELDRARNQQRSLERLTEGVESRYVEARVQLSAAMVQYYHGPTEAIVETFQVLAAALRAMGARGEAAQATRFAAWACARHRRFDDYTRLATRAAADLDAIASELDPAQRVLFMLNKWNGRDELVAGRMRDLLGRARQPRRGQLIRSFREIGELTHWPIADALGGDNANLLASTATSDAAARWLAERLATTRSRPFRARGLTLRSTLSLWRVPSRTLILHYHALPDRTYMFRVARGHIDVRTLPVGRVHLNLDYQQAVTSPEQMTWLAANLGITEALADFPGIRRLVMVPHHEIAEVPFAALPAGAGPLCGRVEITQLDRVDHLRPRWRRARCTRFIVVGLSKYLGSGFRDLDAAEREANEVAKAFGADAATEAYLGAQASRPAVLAALPTASHVHVAAHGEFDANQPADSGIILRDGSARGYTTVSLAELRRLDLRKVHLVTLATCRSAKAAALPGRERICLPSALLDAGARGVIASLWPVQDQPSVDLMVKLYQRMRTERPSAALAHLQAEAAAESLAPDMWAGLAFYGND